MILEIGLREFLLTIAPVTSLVHDRIFGIVRSQASELPALLLQRIHTARQIKFCGTDKLVNTDMQVDSYAATGQDAWSLAAAVRAALVDYVGNMGATFVEQVNLTNEFPLTDPDPGIIRVTQLYNFWYVED